MKKKSLSALLLAAVALFSAFSLLMPCFAGNENNDNTLIKSLDDLNGQKIAVLTGTLGDRFVEEYIPGASYEYYNTNADMAAALEHGKVKAYLCDEPIARMLMKTYPDQYQLTKLRDDTYGYIYKKGNPKTDTFRKGLDDYIDRIIADGTIEEIDRIWFGDDESLQTVKMPENDENGTIILTSSSDVGMPFFTIKDGQYVGYDLDIIARYCCENGYGIKIVDTNFAGVLTNIQSGKCDLGFGCITITEERMETMTFSHPNYIGGILVIVNGGNSGTENQSFFGSIVSSFEKTFIRESRWKMFLSGIGITILISLSSVIIGSALGFGLYMLNRREIKAVNAIIRVISDILAKTPILVILMILYFIIFGKAELSGIWISIIGFSILFAFSVLAQLTAAADTIDKGQTEAALALGYTDTQSFMRIILPQALKHFFPGFRGEVVSLIKGTSVVGFITVQDLTKVSDIVRSRTYEAFFPLIVTAILYFIIAWLITLLIRRIEIGFDPKRRTKETILRGIERQ